MPNKLTPRNEQKHNNNHKEFFEPKIQMMVCGCGNRRILTIDEEMKYGIIKPETTKLEMTISTIEHIPERGR